MSIPDPASPPLEGLSRQVLRLGPVRAVAAITLLSVLASLLTTALALCSLSITDRETWVTAAFIAVFVPMVVATGVGVLLVRMLMALDAAHRQVHQLAITDSLTGAYNRRHFMALAESAFVQTQRDSRPLSLLMIDADHFKRINDRHGHASGDEVLLELTQALRRSLRQGDVLARWGGEEFVALLPGADLSAAHQVAERIRASAAIVRVKTGQGSVPAVTVSVGLAIRHPQTRALAGLLNDADRALYRAKAGGRNRVEVGLEMAAI